MNPPKPNIKSCVTAIHDTIRSTQKGGKFCQLCSMKNICINAIWQMNMFLVAHLKLNNYQPKKWRCTDNCNEDKKNMKKECGMENSYQITGISFLFSRKIFWFQIKIEFSQSLSFIFASDLNENSIKWFIKNSAMLIPHFFVERH